jgi:glucosylceramidase
MTSTESRRGRVLATCAAAALVASGAAYAVAQAPPAFAATSANVWLTTPDRANLLTQKASVPFGSPGSGAVITVDPNTSYQSMVGFGASLTDSAAWNIYNSPARNSIMTAATAGRHGLLAQLLQLRRRFSRPRPVPVLRRP